MVIIGKDTGSALYSFYKLFLTLLRCVDQYIKDTFLNSQRKLFLSLHVTYIVKQCQGNEGQGLLSTFSYPGVFVALQAMICYERGGPSIRTPY